MNRPNEDQGVVIVTGGAGGLGAAVVNYLADTGYRPVIFDVQDDAGRLLAEEVGSEYLRHDVTRVHDWQANLTATVERHGPVYGLVNAAGILTGYSFDEPDVDAFARVLAVNQVGVSVGIQVVGAHMRSQQRGSIVNICSAAGLAPTRSPDLAYTSSKWGVRGVSRVAALALAPHGVRVNSVLPGLTDTPMVSLAQQPTAHVSRIVSTIPMGRVGQPLDIARAVYFFLSELSGYCTAAELVVHGGLCA